MKSSIRSSLTLFTFLALCLIALQGQSSYTQAAAVPSKRQLSVGGKLYGRSRGAGMPKAKRSKQKTFAVKDSCGAAKVSSSSAKSSSTTKAKTTSTAKSTTAKTTTTAKATAVKTSSAASAKATTTTTASAAAATSAKAATTTTTATVTKTSTTTKTVSSTSSAASSTSSIVLTSNSGSYGETELEADLDNLMDWADDDGNLTSAQKKEVIAALLSASARYYPEMPTEVICRIMLSDIRAESDFDPTNISGGRLDSGSSWGLLQVSPNGGSQELVLFQQHANVLTHNFTYGMPDDVRANVRGPLLDYATGATLNLTSLTNDDLFRPWINIHVAMWIQSNLARSSSQDPYSWAAMNDYSWQLKTQALNATSAKVSNKWQTLLEGASLPTTIKTGLGSWVAGPAMDGEGSYLQSGDDISTQYINAIMKSVRHLYGVTNSTAMPNTWLDSYSLNGGLVDYRTY